MWDLNEADHNPVTVVCKVDLANSGSQVRILKIVYDDPILIYTIDGHCHLIFCHNQLKMVTIIQLQMANIFPIIHA